MIDVVYWWVLFAVIVIVGYCFLDYEFEFKIEKDEDAVPDKEKTEFWLEWWEPGEDGNHVGEEKLEISEDELRTLLGEPSPIRDLILQHHWGDEVDYPEMKVLESLPEFQHTKETGKYTDYWFRGNLPALWETIKKFLDEHPAIANECIVTAEGMDGWDDYVHLHNYTLKEGEKADGQDSWLGDFILDGIVVTPEHARKLQPLVQHQFDLMNYDYLIAHYTWLE